MNADLHRTEGGEPAPASVHQEFYHRLELAQAEECPVEFLVAEAGLDAETAEKLVPMIRENLDLFGAGVGRKALGVGVPATSNQQPATSNSTSATELATAEALLRARDLQERGFLLMETYGKNHGNVEMARRVMLCLLGFHALAGAEDVEQLVAACGGDIRVPSQWTSLKATVNKCIHAFQKQLPELPPLRNQRTAQARANMAAAGRKNWHGALGGGAGAGGVDS